VQVRVPALRRRRNTGRGTIQTLPESKSQWRDPARKRTSERKVRRHADLNKPSSKGVDNGKQGRDPDVGRLKAVPDRRVSRVGDASWQLPLTTLYGIQPEVKDGRGVRVVYGGKNHRYRVEELRDERGGLMKTNVFPWGERLGKVKDTERHYQKGTQNDSFISSGFAEGKQSGSGTRQLDLGSALYKKQTRRDREGRKTVKRVRGINNQANGLTSPILLHGNWSAGDS